MMDPAVKTAFALCVLLGGFCAALLFRNENPQPVVGTPQPNESLLLRFRARASARAARDQASANAPARTTGTSESATPDQPPTVVTPSDRREAPPSLSTDYPDSPKPAASPWQRSMEMMLPVAQTTNLTTHTVVDGDTLPALAERYLGASDRANELFEANRQTLTDPSLLPIGVELKIPPRNRP